MKVYTTEITSDSLESDNALHHRLLFPYMEVSNAVGGDLLEIGCGEGRGVALLQPHCTSYTAVDKIGFVVEKLSKKYPSAKFIKANIPPLTGLADNSFDTVISFQVIEHIKDDHAYLKEIYRVLKPGGTAYITTPNRLMSLSRNPWHEREYTPDEMRKAVKTYFPEAQVKGIFGNEKVMQYHEENRRSVQRIMKFDILNLQYRLPASWLRAPYEYLNRRNRNKLHREQNQLSAGITYHDFYIADEPEGCLDYYCVLKK